MRKLAAFMALMMITMACLSTAFAEEHDIRIHTFAVPIKNKVNVRREPAGSIRGTIDKEDSVYILDTTVKRNKTWCCVIVLDDGWYQAYIQADYLIPLHDVASDVIKVDGGANHVLLLRSDGTCLALGYSHLNGLKVSNWRNVKDIAAARFSSIALLQDGTILIPDPDAYDVTPEILAWENTAQISGFTMDVDLGGMVTGIDHDGNPLFTSQWEAYMGTPVPSNWVHVQQISNSGSVAACLTEEGYAHVVISQLTEQREPEASEDLMRAEGITGVRQLATGDTCLVLLMEDGSVRFFGKDEYGAKACETWTDIKMIDACEQYVIGLRSDGSVVMAGKMESRDCHPGVYAEGRHETTYVNFSEDGQLDSWTDMVYIDASGQFILGIHADGSPDMIGSYRYNP